MADETTSQRTAPDGPQDGQPDRTSQTQAPVSEQSQDAPQNEDKQPEVNLYDLPEFRQIQSGWTKKQQETERRFHQQIQYERQRAAQMESRLEELELAGKDDYEKLEVAVKRRDEKIAQYEQWMQSQQQAQQVQQQKQEDIRHLVETFELSRDEERQLQEASNEPDASYHAILRRAKEIHDSRLLSKQQREEQKRENNRVDTGGGRASTPNARAQQEIQKAWARGDVQEWMRLNREAKNF